MADEKEPGAQEQAPPAPPVLDPGTAEIVQAAQKQGVSVREYVRRLAQSEAQSVAAAEAKKQVGRIADWQQNINERGTEFDLLVKGLNDAEALKEGVDLTTMRNSYVAQGLSQPIEAEEEPPKETPPGETTPPAEETQNPMMLAATALVQEAGLAKGDPELETLKYDGSWTDLYESIKGAGATKAERLGKAPLPTEAGARGAPPADNPIEEVNNPDALLGMVEWDKLSLPKG